MSFQAPITIKKALENIHEHDYVLPAIQREFVWKPSQICRLFDSLMQGYPIGSFLFWKVKRENRRKFTFYDFVREYHERDRPHCEPLGAGYGEVTAVLDGQQRLTALNIGLNGSHASKEPRMRRNNPAAYPEKRLFLNLLNLCEIGAVDDNEEGMRYGFAFLTAGEAARRDERQCWFPVWRIMEIDQGPGIYEYLIDNNLERERTAFRQINDLYQVVHQKAIINFYLEEEQENLNKVLNIFIRVNSGGTVLSYSDLLLSMATAEWECIDARKAIYALVDCLNDTKDGFSFSKDFVLKAGLMLAEIASVGFKVANFTRENMRILAELWPRVETALRLTVQLVADFGFSGQTLSADSSLLPIAYYIFQRQLDDSYLVAGQFQADRNVVRDWLVCSLLKSGIWGSGLDTLLTALRTAIRDHGQQRFPIEEIKGLMAQRGKSLRFEEEEIQDLVDMCYGDKRAFCLLSRLYRFIDLRNRFHIDHVFPQSRFTKARLAQAGVPDDQIEGFQDRVNRLPNLQLLDGTANQEKSDALPREWIERRYPDAATRRHYLEQHDLGEIPAEFTDFCSWYDARRARLVDRIRHILGVQAEGEAGT